MPKLFIRAEAVRLLSWNSKPKVSRSRKPASVAACSSSPTRPVFVLVVARASFTSVMFSPKLLRQMSCAITPRAASSSPVAPVWAESRLLPAMKSVPICSTACAPLSAADAMATMAAVALSMPITSRSDAPPVSFMASPRLSVSFSALDAASPVSSTASPAFFMPAVISSDALSVSFAASSSWSSSFSVLAMSAAVVFMAAFALFSAMVRLSSSLALDLPDDFAASSLAAIISTFCAWAS